jgi:hypothetical protein
MRMTVRARVVGPTSEGQVVEGRAAAAEQLGVGDEGTQEAAGEIKDEKGGSAAGEAAVERLDTGCGRAMSRWARD